MKGIDDVNSLPERFQLAFQVLKRGIASSHLELEEQVTGPQLYMLHFIEEKGKCKLTQLAERLDVKPSAITVMIDRLEKSRYVKRTRDDEDRRAVWAEVTDEGKLVLRRARDKQNRKIETYLTKLTPEEAEQAVALLEKMISGD
jgi:MarR family transcriptional regulator, organic hydroperoxide resistance regulator